jgi:tRNA(Ile)-lysidine synthase
MNDIHQPIRPEELDGLFARFAAFGPCALGVSGGSDSTSLMVLLADWLRQQRAEVSRYTVLTVDHGLRATSAGEARAVAATAAELGYRHATLVWEGSKPRAGIQAAARAARYRLMGGYMQAHGITLLLTAHTRDDQAETLLMRLARGSGLDGLAAMPPLSPLGDRGPGDIGAGGGGHWIGRPFLDVPKACLRATLEARGVRWMEDPSNIAPEFERARLRAARPHLDALGLTPAMLALSAARLARARRTIEGMVDSFCDPSAGAVSVDPLGVIAIDRAGLRQAGEEIALRVLDRAIAAAGGAAERVPLGKLEPVLAAVCNARPVARPAAPGRWTLARALITVEGPVVYIERELGREPLPELALAPGRAALWDGRFRVAVAAGFPGGTIEVRALSEADVRDLRRRGVIGKTAAKGTIAGFAGRAAAAVPSMWREDRLVAVPALGYWMPPHGAGDVTATFLGLPNAGKAPSSAETRGTGRR